ncbi:TPA: hypothetical protein RXK68_004807 [Escherichia coli]|nr:hypothetical protein [Escherichia coli]
MTLAAITMTAPEAASPVQMYRATYSPDDNKLRLYAASRLDPECCRCGHHEGDCASDAGTAGGGIQPD